MSTELLVKFCSPTLAGLKVASLFSCKYKNEAKLDSQVAHYNELLNHKGIYFCVLRANNGNALIYVFRKNTLGKVLADGDIRSFLGNFGYADFDITSCLAILTEHLTLDDFPHEIGIFLGYPLDDVIAFVENKGKGHKCVGCWKVYTNVQEAKAMFCKFDKCTRIYREKLLTGTEITRLTVAV